MKTFTIKSTDLSPSKLELVTEIENGYVVRIVRQREDWEDEIGRASCRERV